MVDYFGPKKDSWNKSSMLSVKVTDCEFCSGEVSGYVNFAGKLHGYESLPSEDSFMNSHVTLFII
jgi:hypothetical protein